MIIIGDIIIQMMIGTNIYATWWWSWIIYNFIIFFRYWKWICAFDLAK